MKITRKDTAEGIKFHSELNPKLWENERLRPEVSDKLKQIALAFIDSLDIPIKPKDVVITGSSANYNYTRFSDIDLHVIVDYTSIPNAEEFFYAKKALWNKEHDITVRGFDVELYVEDSRVPANSTAVWSLRRDRWSRKPEPIEIDVDHVSVRAKANFIVRLMQDMENSLEDVQRVLDRIYRMRQSGLERGGEFSTENLAFKVLRNKGVLDTLKDRKRKLEDRELSLEGRVDELNRAPLTKMLQVQDGFKRMENPEDVAHPIAGPAIEQDILWKFLKLNFNIQPIGSGGFAQIYRTPKGAVKVFSVNDSSYLSFVKLAVENRDNPHFPRFLGKPRRIPGTRMMFVRMELLQDTTDEFSTYWEKYPRLLEAYQLVEDNLPSGATLDLYANDYLNYMLRADGTPVITDPYVTGFNETRTDELDRDLLTKVQNNVAIGKRARRGPQIEASKKYQRDIVEDHLRALGYNEPVSHGSWGSVFPLPNYVVKIFSINDAAYLDFLKYVMENQNNPHLPKILKLPYRIPKTDLVLVRLEKLERYTKEQMPQVRGAFPQLAEVISEINRIGQSHGHYEDVDIRGTSNIMLRNGVPVIIDPWYQRGTSPSDPDLPVRGSKRPKRTGVKELDREPLTRLQRTRDAIVKDPTNSDLPRWMYRDDLKDDGSIDLRRDIYIERQIITDFLRDNFGVKPVSSGGFASVYQTHKGVVKLFTARDIGYLGYLNFIAKNPNNPHVPKLLGKPRKIPGTRMMFVRLEPLIEPSFNVERVLNTVPSFRETFEFLRDNVPENVAFDMETYTDRNYMLRADGTPVITDPWSMRNMVWEERTDELNRKPLTKYQRQRQDAIDNPYDNDLVRGVPDQSSLDDTGMKLDVEGESFHQTERDMLQRFLFKIGVTRFRSGVRGDVFMAPNYAVKVYSGNDRAYQAFHKLALQHQDNPHLPKFKGRPYRVPGTSLNVVRMEKLEDIDSSRVFMDYFEKYPKLKETYDWLMANRGKHYPDLSELSTINFMLRPDGTPVITDPWGGPGGPLREDRVDELDRRPLTRFQKEIKDQRDRIMNGPQDDPDDSGIPMDDIEWGERQQWALKKFLHGLGVDVLGSGGYATVFQIPGKPYVVKVFNRADAGYAEYLRMIPELRKGPYARFVPKILGNPYPIPETKLMAIRLEKLLEWDKNKAIRVGLDGFIDYLRKHAKNVPAIFSDLLFDRNIMLRADGTPVVIDPYGSDAYAEHEVEVPRKVKEARVDELDRSALTRFQKERKALLKRKKSEIDDADDEAFYERKALTDFLKDNFGIERIGKGAYAAVYEVPGKPFVVKVFSRLDRGYIAYLHRIPAYRKTEFTPFVPRVMGTPVRIPGTGLAMVRLEKLTRKFQRDAIPAEMYPVWERFLAELERVPNEEVSHIFGDLFDKNVMMRADGTPVMLDPWGSDAQFHQQVPRSGIRELTEQLDTPVEIFNILGKLKKLSISDRIFVVGSVAKANKVPTDLDIVINYSELPFVPHGGEITKEQDVNTILNIAREQYGWLDPFILFSDRLLVRSDDADRWIVAKNQKELRKEFISTMIPLQRVSSGVRVGIRELNRAPLTAIQKNVKDSGINPDADDEDKADAHLKIVKNYLEKMGVKVLDGGSYSLIYDVPGKPYIVKLFFTTDAGYIEYLKMIPGLRKSKFSMFIPRILSNPYVIPGTNLAVVRVEKLTKFDHAPTTLQKSIMTNSEFMEFVRYLNDHAESNQETIFADLGEKNIAFRGNTPVVIDPWGSEVFDSQEIPRKGLVELNRSPLTAFQRELDKDDPDMDVGDDWWDDEIDMPEDVRERGILKAFLKKHGVVYSGEGAFATVYDVPNKPYVIKVFTLTDTGYMNYLKLIPQIRKTEFANFVPRFYGRPYRIPNTKLGVIKIEKLQHGEKTSLSPVMAEKLNQFILFLDKNRKYRDDSDYVSQNIMYRADGTPVVTDPWSNMDHEDVHSIPRKGLVELERRPLTSLQKQIRANLDSDPFRYAGDKKALHQRNHLLYHLRGLGLQGPVEGGNWANVYEMPNYVAKVFSIQDKAYLAFLDLVQNGPSSPHLPKILKLPYRIPKTNLGLVRLEKLYEISENEMPEINRKYPEFKEFMKQILAIGLARGFDQDIEPGDRFNVMKRADGTPVIIDPWFTKYASAREPLEDMPLKGSRRVREARTRVSELDRKSLTGLQQKLRGAPRVNPDYRGLEQAWRKDQRRVLTNHLRSLGWSGSAGSGHWANVFVLPNYAVKVFSQYDRAYLDFIRYAMQHQDNPHLPKILKLPYRIPGSELIAVRMEKLQDFPRWSAQEVYDNYPELGELVGKIRDLGVSRGYAGDVESGQLYNLMQRPDGTPVITDPWYTDNPVIQEPEGVSMRDAKVPPETKKKVRMRQNPGWTEEDDEILRQLGESRVDELDRKTLTAIQQRIRAERDPNMEDYEGFRERRAIAKEIADRYGFRVDARGNWASVYVRKNDVVKVFSLNDVGYRGYLKYAMENQDNPHIPKVLKKPYRIPGTMVGVVRLERLKSPDNTSKEYAGRFPAFASLLAKMRYVGTIQGHVFDILPDGANNFMLRVDGTPVITDPWYTSDHSITPDDVFGDTSIEPVPNQLRQEDTQNLLDKLGQALEGLEIDRVDELDRSPLTRYQKFVKDSPAMDRNGDPDAIGFQDQRILKKFLSQYGIKRISDGLYADVFEAPDGSIVKVVRHSDFGYMSFVRMFREVPEEFRIFLPKIQRRPYDIPGTSLAVFRLERLQRMKEDNITPELVERFNQFKDWLNQRVPEDCFFDLSHHNMMLRPDGTPVVTDPYAPKAVKRVSGVSARDVRGAVNT